MASGEWVISDVSTGATLGQPSDLSAGLHTVKLWGVDQHGARVSSWKRGAKFFWVGILLDFVRLTTRTMHPHGGCIVRAEGQTKSN